MATLSSAVDMRNINTVIPDGLKKSLVIMHLAKEKYETVEKVCALLRDKGPLCIRLDAASSTIHSAYGLETFLMQLKLHGLHLDYLQDMHSDFVGNLQPNSSFTVPSKNGTLYEINLPEIEAYIQKSADKLNARHLKGRISRWLEKNRPYCGPEELSALEKSMKEGEHRELENALKIHLGVLSRPFVELKKTVQKTLCSTQEEEMLYMRVRDDTEWVLAMLHQKLSIQKVFQNSLKMVSETDLLPIAEEAIQLRKKRDMAAHSDFFKEEVAACESLQQKWEKEDSDFGIELTLEEKDALSGQRITRTITTPLKFKSTRFEGTPEEYFLHKLEEQGFLTEEHVGDLCALASDGLELIAEIATAALMKKELRKMKKEGNSTGNILAHILHTGKGFCLGESHDMDSSRQLLIEHMPLFAKLGVTALYLEGFEHSFFQPLFQAYHREKALEMPEELLANVPAAFIPLIKSAKEAGIEVVAAENGFSRTAALIHHFESEEEYGKIRLTTANSDIVSLIEQRQKEDSKHKFIVLCGAGHVIEDLGVVGISSLLRCASVVMEDCLQKMCIQRKAPELVEDFDIALPVPTSSTPFSSDVSEKKG